jgi:arsenate reductase
MSNKINILFLCTGNSCRSQMAEALCRDLKGDIYEVYSAGIEQHGMNPRAVAVLAEIGLDTSSHSSKTLEALSNIKFDQVVTVCAHADQNCPVFMGKARATHIGFDDPPKLARNARTEEQALQHFRRVRDEIREFVLTLPQALN